MPETELFYEIASLSTEQNNERTNNIDTASTLEILELINYEDSLVAEAVRMEIPNITLAVDSIVKSFRQGGRLFYFGAGTSGRLGILDASECPPTFGVSSDMVQGIIAGGKEAVFKAQEGAEDSPDNGKKEVIERNILPPDIVCGIAASGRTPFVKGALEESRKRGVFTIFISTSTPEKIKEMNITADVYICPQVGPEVITGSTRMKSGTAQKLILNMLTTASMIRLGKTFGNVMVDLQLTNAKLKERAKKIIMSLADVSYDDAEKALTDCEGSVKTALVMLISGVSATKARKTLEESDGFIKAALKKLSKENY
jgi:N-acetylmuramic acid 6-phosphate etherase